MSRQDITYFACWVGVFSFLVMYARRGSKENKSKYVRLSKPKSTPTPEITTHNLRYSIKPDCHGQWYFDSNDFITGILLPVHATDPLPHIKISLHVEQSCIHPEYEIIRIPKGILYRFYYRIKMTHNRFVEIRLNNSDSMCHYGVHHTCVQGVI